MRRFAKLEGSRDNCGLHYSMTAQALLSWILLAAIGYGILLLLLYLFQTHLIYLPYIPTRAVIATPDQIGLAFEAITLTTDDGVALKGWYIPSPQARGTILFFHGNAGNIGHRLDSLQLFHTLGLAIFIIDYRGYGQSQAQPTETGTYLDAYTAWHYLANKRRIPANEIIIFGRSLGAAIAAQLATHFQPGALILESAFTSIPDLGAELYPFLPVRWLVRFQYNTRHFLEAVTCPLLIIHSQDDTIISSSHGHAIFKAARPPKQFLLLQGGHNDAFLVSRQKYSEEIDSFLQAYFDS